MTPTLAGLLVLLVLGWVLAAYCAASWRAERDRRQHAEASGPYQFRAKPLAPAPDSDAALEERLGERELDAATEVFLAQAVSEGKRIDYAEARAHVRELLQAAGGVG